MKSYLSLLFYSGIPVWVNDIKEPIVLFTLYIIISLLCGISHNR